MKKNCVNCYYFDDYYLYSHWIFHCRKTKAVLTYPDSQICKEWRDPNERSKESNKSRTSSSR